MVNSTANANELFCFFAPGYSVEVGGSATRVANESPMKVASGIVTVQVKGCFADGILLISRLNYLAIFAFHLFTSRYVSLSGRRIPKSPFP